MAIAGTLMDGAIVRGDQFPVRRTLRINPGFVVTEAWLTVKAAYADADPGIFQKLITPVNAPGTGHIDDPGTDGFVSLRFDVSSANTLALTADQQYVYDIQILTNETPGLLLTVERGAFTPVAQVTIDA